MEEHLQYYARIKGIPEGLRKRMVERQLKVLNLGNHREKTAKTLSGGNKRKLSVAIALIGNPPIVLMDEPSAGMDPKARRVLWSAVSKVGEENRRSAVVLTTHSMEEAEALSTKMGIMVRGGIFKCIGSSQHLKNKFGKGYEIEFRIRPPLDSELHSSALTFGFNPSTDFLDRLQLSDLLSKLLSLSPQSLLSDSLTHPNLLSRELFQESSLHSHKLQLKTFLTWLYV